jgi:hypothetical protein
MATIYSNKINITAQKIITYTLGITVDDINTCNPIENASVTINGTTQKTNSDGFVSFTLQAGDYTIDVSASGYNDVSKQINITEDSTTIIYLSPVICSFNVSTSVGSGSGYVNPIGAIISGNDQILFTAIPDGGYAFGYWIIKGNEKTSPQITSETLVINAETLMQYSTCDSSVTIIAYFKQAITNL